MHNPEHRVAAIYGPVGYVVQEPGQKPTIEMRDQWKHIEDEINEAIMRGMGFVGNDLVVRVMTKDPLDEEHLEALSKALGENSGGDLYAIKTRPD